MNKVPEKVRRSIFSNWLAGKKTRENAELHGVSLGTVFGIVQSYLKRLKEKDPEAMKHLALFCTQKEIDFMKLARLINLGSVLHAEGVSMDDSDVWVQQLLLLSKESPEKVGKLLVEILKVSDLEGTPPILTLERLRRAKDELKMEQANLATYKEQAAKAKLKCDEELARVGLTKEYVDRFIQLDTRIRGWGLIKEEQIVCFLEEMKKRGHDPNQVAAELSSKDKLRKEYKQLYNDYMRLAKGQQSMREKDNFVKLLYALPLNEETWMKFDIKARARALHRGEDVETAAERILIELLDSYDPMHGLEMTKLKLHNYVRVLQKKMIELELANTELLSTNTSLQQENEKAAIRKEELLDDNKQLEEYKKMLQNDAKKPRDTSTLPKVEKVLLDSEKQQQSDAPTMPTPTPAPEPNIANKSGVVYFGNGSSSLQSGIATTLPPS
jgi:hypothetical protein